MVGHTRHRSAALNLLDRFCLLRNRFDGDQMKLEDAVIASRTVRAVRIGGTYVGRRRNQCRSVGNADLRGTKGR